MQILANGIQLEFEEYGPATGVPLVLIRGLGTQMAHWSAEFLNGFANLGYRVIIFDNRDVGLSQRCPKEGVTGNADDIIAVVERGETLKTAYTLNDMALDVIGLLDALNIDKAHIFGISMGGGIAQLLVCNHANRIKSATIVMTAARFSAPELLKRLLVYPETREQYQQSLIDGNQEWGSPGFQASDTYFRAQAGLAWDRGYDADGVNRQALATSQSGDWREALKSVSSPCLVIHGAQDTLVPPEAGKEIADCIPDAKFNLVQGMGHTITPLLSPVIVEMVDIHIKGTGPAGCD